jgi:peptide deformylase
MEIVPISKIPGASDIQDAPIDRPMDVYKVCQDMDLLCKQHNGIGLSAVQVGVPWRLFLVRRNGGTEFYANCKYEPDGVNRINTVEGCLSLRDATGQLRSFRVPRYSKVVVKGLKLNPDVPCFEEIEMVLENDFYRVVFQHEIDHQNQILISQIGQEIIVW